MGDFQELSNTELIRTINDEADKRGLSADSVFCAIEEALRVAGKEKYGNNKLKVSVDRKTGSISILKQIIVVEDDVSNQYVYDSKEDDDVVDVYEAMKISEAHIRYPDQELEVGSIMSEGLLNVEFGRLAVRSARYAISNLIRDLEQEKQYQQYKDRVGDVVIGSARRTSRGGVVVDLGDAESYLPMKYVIRGENFRQGDRIKAIVVSVKRDNKHSQITLSRASNDFVSALFKQEVPEIYDGIITIHSIARESGSKAKVAVHSSDKNVDPVGACVGIRSTRIRSIMQELNGEKIDVIIHSPDIAEFVINAITPARAIKAIVNEDKRVIDLIVEQDQLSLAIGKKGQNVRLASVLVGFDINLLSEGDASKKKLEEFGSDTATLVAALNIEEIIAQLLITEGFVSVGDIASADITRLSTIEGFDIDIASELLKRAQEYLSNNSLLNSALNVLPGIDHDNMSLLHNCGIDNLEALAELSKEDFNDVVRQHNFTEEKINDLIMSARKELGWFKE